MGVTLPSGKDGDLPTWVLQENSTATDDGGRGNDDPKTIFQGVAVQPLSVLSLLMEELKRTDILIMVY